MTRYAALMLVASCLAGCGGVGAKTEPTTPATLTPAQWSAVQDGVRGALKDPESARFGAYQAVRSLGPDGAIIVCGRVNAKNSHGGYTGELPYGGMLAEIGPNAEVRKFTPFGVASVGKNGDIGVYMACKKYGINIDA